MKALAVCLLLCLGLTAHSGLTEAQKKSIDDKVDALVSQLDQADQWLDHAKAQTVMVQGTLDRYKAVDAKLTAANKKLDREVWIYKGGFTIIIMLGLGYLLFKAGIITKMLPLVLGLAAPWGEIALAVLVPAFIGGTFAAIWHYLP